MSRLRIPLRFRIRTLMLLVVLVALAAWAVPSLPRIPTSRQDFVYRVDSSWNRVKNWLNPPVFMGGLATPR